MRYGVDVSHLPLVQAQPAMLQGREALRSLGPHWGHVLGSSEGGSPEISRFPKSESHPFSLLPHGPHWS